MLVVLFLLYRPKSKHRESSKRKFLLSAIRKDFLTREI